MKPLPLAKKIELLFEFGQSQGLPITYQAVSSKTGIPANNILKIRKGQNLNPGLQTLVALTDYFGVEIGYFRCKTETECRNYLQGVASEEILNEIALRAEGISAAGLETIRQMIHYVRSAEGL